MTALAIVFAIGLGLSLLPWRPVACGVMVAVAIWAWKWVFGPDSVYNPLAMLLAPALLLGWSMGLLICRTIAERRAR